MKKNYTIIMLCTFIAILHLDVLAEGSLKDALKLDFSGSGYIMFGQIIRGHEFSRNKDNPIDHRWQDFYGGNLILSSNPTDWFTSIIGVEVMSAFPITTTSGIMKETYKIQYRSFLPKAEGIFHWNFGILSSLLIESGIFPYNFNPEIKNLGNYLYRGNAYPLYLETKLDDPYTNLMGIRTLFGFLQDQIRIEAILNSVINHAPFYDFSLAFILSYTSKNKFFDAAAGICFNRIYSVDDSATDAMNFYSSSGWDTTWTLRSRKVDVRFTLDPKQLFGNPEIFSPEDLKIYAEMGILGGDKGKDSLLFGFEDPEYFDMNPDPTMLHRMPFLLGINVPVFNISNLLSHEMVWPFKVLLYSSLPYTIWDLASLEMEWFNSPYSNDWWGGKDGAPSPVPYDISWDPEWDRIYRRRDNFKWTVYLKKSISKFDIITIFANDHTIYQTYNAETHPNTEQSLRKRKDWHWYLKFNYNL